MALPGPPEFPHDDPPDLNTRPPGLEDSGVGVGGVAGGWPSSSAEADGAVPVHGATPRTTLYEQHYYRAFAHLQSGGLPFDHYRGTVLGGRGGKASEIAEADRGHNIQAAGILWEIPEPGQRVKGGV